MKCLSLCIVFSCFILSAQEQYAVNKIPDSLKKGADAVIRNQSYFVTVQSENSIKYRLEKAVTILNSSDNVEYLNFFYDPSSQFISISAIVYDAEGNEIKKYRNKDFDDYSATSSGTLHDDNRRLSLRIPIASYPITIYSKYEYTDKNTALIRSWNPINNHRLAVEKSSYALIHNPELGLNVNEVNIPGYNIQKNKSQSRIEYTLVNQKAIPLEAYSPSLYEYVPYVDFAFKKFTIEGISGEASNWNELGLWYYNELLKGTDNINNDMREEIKRLVGLNTNTEEKVKLIYQYVQNRSRYIGVQLGIGGLKPYNANKVHELGYGDCKGLTNYTRTLLKSTGINSYFTLVYGGRKIRDVDTNNVSLVEGNHIILCVPNGNDSIWLECTSQDDPYNYLGSFTDDRDVILITETGGKFAHTSTYTTDENAIKSAYEISFDSLFYSKISLKRESKGVFYERNYKHKLETKERREDYIKEFGNLTKVVLTKEESEIDKNSCKYVESLEFKGKGLAFTNGKEAVISLCPFGKMRPPKRYKNRETPFAIERNIQLEDSIVYEIPINYVINELPQGKEIDSKFGKYQRKVIEKEGKLYFHSSLTILKGEYSKEEYEEFRKFIKRTLKTDNQKFVLTSL